MARRASHDDINIQISSGGRTVNTSLAGLRQAADSQLELDGMPQKPKKEKEPENPFRQALRLAPFVVAPEMEQIGRELACDHHSARWDDTPDILYLFSAKEPAPHAWGICRKVSSHSAWLWRHLAAQGKAGSDPVNIDALNRKMHADGMMEEDYNLPVDRLVVPATPLFLIVVQWETWEYLLTPAQRRALIDHELCHVGVDRNDKGDLVYSIIEHEYEEFPEIVARHGIWNRGVKRLKEAIETAVASGVGPVEDLP